MTPSTLPGAWSLISWTLIRPDGSHGYPAGTNAEGQLIYTLTGHVSVHLLVPGTPRFASDDLAAATAVEMTGAWPRYFGYYGRYTVDEAAGTVTHHIEGSSFPNIIGADQIRRISWDGDRLVLDADEAWGVVRMTWERTN